MDRGPDTTDSHQSRILDDVLRRVVDEEGRRRRAGLHVTPQGLHEVHGSSPFPSSNNVAEYEALINGLRITIELGIRRLDIQGDSQLVINQVMKESSYHDAKMAAYYREVRWLEDKFDGLELNHILWRLNEAADALAKAAFGREPVPMSVFASGQHKPSVRYEGSERSDDGPSDPTSGADQPMAPSGPKVMELEEDLMTEPDPLDD